jgi:hypothetical protein
VIGEKVGLSPLWVLLALLVGAELFGFLGVLLALPTAAVLKIFVVRALRAYRASRLYTGEAPVASAGADGIHGAPPPTRAEVDAPLASSVAVEPSAPPPQAGAEAAPSPVPAASPAPLPATSSSDAVPAVPPPPVPHQEEPPPSSGGG